jgi:transcriptional regulator with XRE-family HTH domain
VTDQKAFFRELGQRVRDLRKQKGFTQEDMISFGFSARHWQQIEAGRPITVRTLLRIGEVFSVSLADLVIGLDNPNEMRKEELRPKVKEPSPKSNRRA